jgi:hypothetical protein
LGILKRAVGGCQGRKEVEEEESMFFFRSSVVVVVVVVDSMKYIDMYVCMYVCMYIYICISLFQFYPKSKEERKREKAM